MIDQARMEKKVSVILLAGTLFSALLVTIGGILLLLKEGHQSLIHELHTSSYFHMSFIQIHRVLSHQLPICFIELGILSLVLTQLLRVGLLLVYYVKLRDMAFTLISSFILCVLIYSTLIH